MINLLLLILEVRFKHKTPLIEKDNRVQFIEKISGKPVKQPPNAWQGLDFNYQPLRMRLVLEEERFSISVQIDEEESAQDRLLEMLSKIYRDFQYKNNEIKRIGVRSIWFSDWNSSFTNLVNKYKNIFYKDNTIVSESTDVAVNFILKDKDLYKMNFISGPMKPEQGMDQLIFKDISLPHDFIFVDLDRYKLEGLSNINSAQDIKKVVLESLDYEQSKAKQTVQLLKQ
jgi:hypothetical protein